jgi:hypothetical protein
MAFAVDIPFYSFSGNAYHPLSRKEIQVTKASTMRAMAYKTYHFAYTTLQNSYFDETL